ALHPTRTAEPIGSPQYRCFRAALAARVSFALGVTMLSTAVKLALFTLIMTTFADAGEPHSSATANDIVHVSPPRPPDRLSAHALSPFQIELRWRGRSHNARGFELLR